MLTSCVFRSVLRLISCTAVILGTPCRRRSSQRELDALREDADRFIAELDEEAYLHFAGHKETYDLVPIYERHAELTKLDTALDIGASVNGGRNVRELWRFACEGYLGNFVSEEEEKIAEAETKTRRRSATRTIPYRDLRPRIANADDRGERERLERARNEATEEHNGLYIRKHQVVHRETERLGVAELHRALPRLPAIRSTTSPTSAATFLDSTERSGRTRATASSAAGSALGLGEIERWDVDARLARRRRGTRRSRRTACCPALEATLADLGVDLRAQRNVELDLEDRPNKTPRAFCVPIEVPERVVLVIKPQGGPDDWRALFHEAGPHRAFRAHVAVAHGRGAAARRQRGHRGLGDAARASDDRPGVARRAGSTSRVRSSSPPRERRSCCGCCAATARSCSTRSSSTPSPT